MDVGIYPLNLAAYLFGNTPESVVATSYNENGVDIHTQMTLRYPDGVMASLSCAIGVHKPETAFIYGTDGYIKLPSFYGAQEIILCKDGEEKKISLPSIGEGFEEEIIEACNCINNNKAESATMPHSESMAILSQMDDIRKQIGIVYPLEGEN